MLIAKPVQLKAFLMDQHLIAGIGNIYSDEILYAAGLRYDRMTDTLTTQDIRRLYRAVVEIVHEAVKHRGSSLADEQYRDLFGRVGGYQSEHQATAGRASACRRCRTPIERGQVPGSFDVLLPQLSGLTRRPRRPAAAALRRARARFARRSALRAHQAANSAATRFHHAPRAATAR